MLNVAAAGSFKKVVVLNPKGGSGKTTLAFSLAGYLASTGRSVALLDMDQQRSSTRWLANRPKHLPKVLALEPGRDSSRPIDVPDGTDVVVIDAPAGLQAADLIDYTCGAHAIFVPVLPSDIDIHAASRLVSDLLLRAEVSRRNGRLGIVANRVKERTVAYRQLLRFLDSLSIDLIGVLRDSQNYTHAAAGGTSIHEMTVSRAGKDIAQWQAITDWLEARLSAPLTPRDLRKPAAAQAPRHRRNLWQPTAAAFGALGVALWFLADSGPGDGPAAKIEPLTVSEAIRESAILPIDRETTAMPAAEIPERSLAERWRLTGIVRSRSANVLVLSNREDGSTIHLGAGDALDGWQVSDYGRDFAVFRNEAEEVRLVLNEDTML